MYSFTHKEENMSTLSSLKLTNSKKPTAMPPVQQRRNKLATKVWEQIQFARAQQNGENFTVKKFKTVKDLEGNRKSVEINKRVRPWWYVAQDGKVCLNIRYGARIIEFVKGKSAVEVNSPEELIKALEIIKGAVEAGELDSQIEQVSGAVKASFRR
jgi:hypothetical protein